MKKPIIIIVLAIIQCACATPQATPGKGADILSFDAIGAEISVNYVDLSEQFETSQAVAMTDD